MTNPVLSIKFDHAFGILGLFLMLVVARLTDRAYPVRPSGAGRLSGFLARRAIDSIAAIGWLADRLPILGPSRHSGPSRHVYEETPA